MLPEANRKSLGKIKMPQLPVFNPETNLIRIGDKPNGFFNIDTGRYISVEKEKLKNQLNGSEARHFDFQTELGNMNLCSFELFKGKEKVRWQSETIFSHELLHLQPTLIDSDGQAYCYAALDISKGMLSISLDADWELRANLGHGRFASKYGIHSYAIDLMSIQALFNSTQATGKKPFALSMGLSANGPSFGSSAKLQNFGEVEFSVRAASVSASLGSEVSWERGLNASMSATLGVAGPTASVGYKPVYELCFLGLTVSSEVNLTVGMGHKIEVGAGVTFDKTRPQLRLYTKLGLFSGTGAAVKADWNLGFDSNFATRVHQDIQASIESWKEDSFFKPQFQQLEKMQREAEGNSVVLTTIQEMHSELCEQLAYFAMPRAIWSVITNAFSIREIETIPVEVENAARFYDNRISVIQQLAQELAPQIFGASFVYPTQSDFTTLSFLTLSDTAEQRCAKFDEKFLQDVFKQYSLSAIPIAFTPEITDKENQANEKTNPSNGSKIPQFNKHNFIHNVPREQRLNLEFNLLDSQSGLLKGSYGKETGFSGNTNPDDVTARLSLFKLTSGGMAFAPTLSLAVPLELTALSLGIIGGAALGVGALVYVGKRIYDRQQYKKLPTQTKNHNEITENIIKLQDAINERTFRSWIGWKYSEIQGHFSEKLKNLLDAKINHNRDNLDTVYYAAAQKYAIEQKRHDLIGKWSSNQGYIDKETIDFFQHYLERSASQFEKAIHINNLSDARHIVGDLQSKLPESFLSKYYGAVLCAVENPSQGLAQLKQVEKYAHFPEEKRALKSAEFSLTWSKALENPTQHNIDEVKQFALKNISDMKDSFVSSCLYDFKNQKPYEDKNQIIKSYTEIEKKVILSDDHKRCYARSLYHCAVHEVSDQIFFYKKTISVLCSLSSPNMDDRILKCLAQIATGEENSFLEIKTELQAIRQQLKINKEEQSEIVNDQKKLLENVSIGLANLALAERNIPQAINELTEFESTNGITSLTSRFLADLLFSNQEFSRSIPYFEAVSDFKNDQRLYLSYLLALIESDSANFNSKNRKEIIDKFAQLSNNLEEMGENFNSLKAYLACTGSHLAIIAAEQGDFELAKQIIQKMQQYPGKFNENYSFQLAGLALSCMKMAKEQSSDAHVFLKSVLENCNAVLQVKSTDITAKLIMAHAHFAVNDYSTADQLSEEIVQQIEQHITLTNNTCLEILEADLHTAAKACMLRANIAFQSNMTQQERMKHAIKYNKEALKFNPREIEARKQLGDLARARGQATQAANYYRECLDQESTYLPAMQQLILIQTTEGEFSKARDELGKNKQVLETLNKRVESLERLEEGIDIFEHRISALSWTRLGIFAGNWLLKQGLNHDSSKKYFGNYANSLRCISGGVEWLASPIGQYLQQEFHADLERSAGNESGENKVFQNTLHDPRFWLHGYNIAAQVMIQNKWIDRDGDFKTAIDLGEMGQQVLSLGSDVSSMASLFYDAWGEDGDITDYSDALVPVFKQLFKSIRSICKDSLKANGQMMYESKWIYMMVDCAQVALGGLALKGIMTLCLDKAVVVKLMTTVKTALSSYSSALMALNPWAIAGGIALCVMGYFAYQYYVQPRLAAEVREAKIHNASVLLKEAQELKSEANRLKKANETTDTRDLIQQAEDKIKMAKQKYQEVLAEQSDHQVAKQALRKLNHDARLQAGEYAIVIEECNKNLTYFLSVKIPTDDDIQNRWYYLLLRGRAYFQNENLHLAENDFSSLLAMDKTHVAMANLQKWIDGDKSISNKPEFDTLQDAISAYRFLSYAKLRRSQYAAAKEHCDAAINLIKNVVFGNQRILSEALGKQWKLGGVADDLYQKVKEHRAIANVVGINDENFRMHVIAEKANSQIVNLEEELEDVQKYYASIEDVLQKAWDGTAGNIAASIINKLSSSMSSVLHDYREHNSQPVTISRWRPSLFHQPSCDDPSKEETLQLLRCLQAEPQEKETAPEKLSDILYSKTNLRFN